MWKETNTKNKFCIDQVSTMRMSWSKFKPDSIIILLIHRPTFMYVLIYYSTQVVLPATAEKVEDARTNK